MGTYQAWLSYPMIVQKCVPDEQTLARDRQHHCRTAFAGKRWRPRYPLPSQHLCRARLRFSRQCQSNIDNHIPQINPWIREPCLENLGRTLPSDEPTLVQDSHDEQDVRRRVGFFCTHRWHQREREQQRRECPHDLVAPRERRLIDHWTPEYCCTLIFCSHWISSSVSWRTTDWFSLATSCFSETSFTTS
ncbi:hypothetical protein CA85_41280 [Allorhodopirellula solitaria]|uniref:Uncharacterized protein n=1 Tax=Allorhodopirellula solitaria TaxID=2527987 RepID=A0A5C5X0C5_9BACT|nr:hypothetical protein CA85_41280 [Allorhodopirellula solitaria]